MCVLYCVCVAQLFGEPEINIFDLKIKDKSKKTVKLLDENDDFCIGDEMFAEVEKYFDANKTEHIHLGVRAKYILLSKEPKDGYNLEATLYAVEPMGNKNVIIVEKNGIYFRCLVKNDYSYHIDTKVYVKIDFKNSVLFDSETQELVYSSYKENKSEEL